MDHQEGRVVLELAHTTLVLDVRYGVSRINTKNLAGNKTGFDDYDSFGVPRNVQDLILFRGVAPNINPNGYGGGNGGGSNWTVSAWIKTTQAGATILNKCDGINWNSGYSTFYLGDGSDTGSAPQV